MLTEELFLDILLRRLVLPDLIYSPTTPTPYYARCYSSLKSIGVVSESVGRGHVVQVSVTGLKSGDPRITTTPTTTTSIDSTLHSDIRFRSGDNLQ